MKHEIEFSSAFLYGQNSARREYIAHCTCGWYSSQLKPRYAQNAATDHLGEEK